MASLLRSPSTAPSTSAPSHHINCLLDFFIFPSLCPYKVRKDFKRAGNVLNSQLIIQRIHMKKQSRRDFLKTTAAAGAFAALGAGAFGAVSCSQERRKGTGGRMKLSWFPYELE
ncbi:MAG: twin-arginine translocation signal domain-containing protein, partial [Bacteroidales bacterium]|nr:twin-arginine translocation signal domain-containing protein [Bacteroidales bacterium]